MADAKQGVNNVSTQSRVVLAKPRLGFGSSSSGASSSSKSNTPIGSVLRPPQLKPTKNPFLKVSSEENDEYENNTVEPSDKESGKDIKEDQEVPKFVPLGSANVTPRSNNAAPIPAPAAGTSSSGFVFGQNLSERVVIQENLNNGEGPASDHTTTNGTSELLFTSAAASVKESNQEECVSNEASSCSGEGLAAAAAEYERSHARPPPPPENVVVTGEEGETNVLQISCRMFAWEAGSWRERGRGVLRLNDAMAGAGTGAGSNHDAEGAGVGGGGGGAGARLVARVSGSLRVVLNTKLWPGMVVERAGTKSLRITAADTQHQIKLYLIMGSPGDIAHLHQALKSRVANSKHTHSIMNNQYATSQQAAERLEAAADANEFLDRPSSDDALNRGDESLKPNTMVSNNSDQIDSAKNKRLESSSEEKTEMEVSSVDNEPHESSESNSLKRKEAADDETLHKRQCPDVSE